MAITKYDMFDFLIDIVPRDELKPNKRQQVILNSFDLELHFIHIHFIHSIPCLEHAAIVK